LIFLFVENLAKKTIHCRAMISPPQTVSVRLPGQSYDIRVGPGLLAQVGGEIAGVTKSRLAFVVTDRTVGPLHAPVVLDSLRSAGFQANLIDLPAGETHKTLATVSMIYDALLAAKVERSTVILSLGGGVIGDMTGFAAATVLRGVPFVQIPTTLLAMVDASVGGKTGVNHPAGKNLIGSFHQPIAVLIDPQTLRTLPAASISEGLAECIKHEIIRDLAGFEALEQNIGRALNLDMDYLSELIAHNVAIKARVVEADPTERGERAHLNFGHTFGHAIEKVSHLAVSHGDAVAMGMCAAISVAEQMNMLDAASRKRIVNLIQGAKLPTSMPPSIASGDVFAAMAHDKKVEASRLRLVLPDRIGHVVIRDDVPADVIRRGIEALLLGEVASC
jgi:3-dehydroquinate synthase